MTCDEKPPYTHETVSAASIVLFLQHYCIDPPTPTTQPGRSGSDATLAGKFRSLSLKQLSAETTNLYEEKIWQELLRSMEADARNFKTLANTARSAVRPARLSTASPLRATGDDDQTLVGSETISTRRPFEKSLSHEAPRKDDVVDEEAGDHRPEVELVNDSSQPKLVSSSSKYSVDDCQAQVQDRKEVSTHLPLEILMQNLSLSDRVVVFNAHPRKLGVHHSMENMRSRTVA